MTGTPRPLTLPALGRDFAAARQTVLRALAPRPGGRDPLAAVAERLGLPVRLLGVEPAAAGALEPGAWCVHLRDAAGARFAVRVDAALAAAAAAPVLGAEPWALPAAGGAEPLAAVLAVQALCCLEALAATGLCVELEDVHHASIERMPAAGRVRLALRLLAGGTVGRAEVEAPAGGAVPEARGRRPVWVDLLPVEIVAVLGRGRIPAGQLRALGVGDAVTFDEAPEGAGGGGPGGAVWIESAAGAARGPRWNGRCDGDGVVLGAPAPLPRAPGRMAMDGEGSGSDRTEVVPQPEGARLSVDDVPIEVTAVAGRATLAVRDLAALGPGSVVGLGRGSGGAIDLLANGVPFGRGRLVDLEGELAVEVTEIRAGALPATGRSS